MDRCVTMNTSRRLHRWAYRSTDGQRPMCSHNRGLNHQYNVSVGVSSDDYLYTHNICPVAVKQSEQLSFLVYAYDVPYLVTGHCLRFFQNHHHENDIKNKNVLRHAATQPFFQRRCVILCNFEMCINV